MDTAPVTESRLEPVEPPASGVLSAVCVVHEIIPNPGETPAVTAIDKRPRPGRLEVGLQGLVLDTQVDRRYHGGEQQALYAYADEDAAYWSAELGREIPRGASARTCGSRASTSAAPRSGSAGASGRDPTAWSSRSPCRARRA